VTSELVVDAARRRGHRQVDLVRGRDEARSVLEAEVAPGDLVITMGAGDIYRLAEEMVADQVPAKEEEA
jgi:UDP-N-acetylmuramate--alanine ligase